MAAIDLNSGKWLWNRHFGEGQILKPHWDGVKLHAFHTTLRSGASHLIIDPNNGELQADHHIEIQRVSGVATNGKPIGDGYFEVGFEPVEARFVRLTTLSEINGRGWASAAELHVVGADGERLSRRGWKATTDSYETQSTRYTPGPDKVLDGDPTSWWHSQWLDGIPEHPHHVALDLGSVQTVKALHYLPAVIVNNNGMIRDYELHVSADGENWGEPVAEGVMVNRVQINRATFADRGAIFLESHDYRTRAVSVYRYDLGGKPAMIVAERARILDHSGPYMLITERRDDKEQLCVLSATDPAYRFDLEPQIPHNRHGEIYIHGDRLVLADRRLVIANLKTRTFIRESDKDEKELHNKHGFAVQIGTDQVLKFVNQGHRGQSLTQIDLRTGELASGFIRSETVPLQINRFRQPRSNPPARRLLSFDGVLLFYDGSTLSAWTRSS